MKNKKVLIFGVAGLIVGALVLVFLVFAMRGAGNTQKEKTNSVTVQKNGNTLTVTRDGHVRFEKDGKLYEDNWEKDKTDAFFDYIDSNYTGEGDVITGGQDYITVSNGSGSNNYKVGDDELIDTVEDDTSGGGGGGGGGSTPTSTPSGGGSTPTPTGTTNYGGPDPNCLFWRLSYCVRKRTPSPTPSVTPTTVEIREPDCSANTQTGKTAISNDLCLPTPSPTSSPTPTP